MASVIVNLLKKRIEDEFSNNKDLGTIFIFTHFATIFNFLNRFVHELAGVAKHYPDDSPLLWTEKEQLDFIESGTKPTTSELLTKRGWGKLKGHILPTSRKEFGVHNMVVDHKFPNAGAMVVEYSKN